MRGPLSISLLASYPAALVAVIAMLGALAIDRGPRRDELLISAIAIVGRGQLLVLLAMLSLALRSQVLVSSLVAAVAIVTGGQAMKMLRRGPLMRHTVPTDWLVEAASVPGPRVEQVGVGDVPMHFAKYHASPNVTCFTNPKRLLLLPTSRWRTS